MSVWPFESFISVHLSQNIFFKRSQNLWNRCDIKDAGEIREELWLNAARVTEDRSVILIRLLLYLALAWVKSSTWRRRGTIALTAEEPHPRLVWLIWFVPYIEPVRLPWASQSGGGSAYDVLRRCLSSVILCWHVGHSMYVCESACMFVSGGSSSLPYPNGRGPKTGQATQRPVCSHKPKWILSTPYL